MPKSLALLALVPLVLMAAGSTAAISGPATPTNLEVIEATETSITIAWGPSQPGPFTVRAEPKRNQLLVGWGASEDSRSAVTYEFVKDGDAPVFTSQPQHLVTGLSPKVRSFRVCVTAVNASGQRSPQACGTYTRGPL